MTGSRSSLSGMKQSDSLPEYRCYLMARSRRGLVRNRYSLTACPGIDEVGWLAPGVGLSRHRCHFLTCSSRNLSRHKCSHSAGPTNSLARYRCNWI